MPTQQPEAKTYTVQEAAQKTGLSEHTLRYYEKADLIEPVGREGSGRHRRYSEANLQTIDFLKRLRETGMPIREMQRFVALYRRGDETLPERYAMLALHRQTVLDYIETMNSHVAVLDYKLAAYETLALEANREDRGCFVTLETARPEPASHRRKTPVETTHDPE